jgi:hypothetical protein
MGVDPRQAARTYAVGVTAENTDGAAEESQPSPCCLPPRRLSKRHRMKPIRCMDDPEILERVLQGLVNLT